MPPSCRSPPPPPAPLSLTSGISDYSYGGVTPYRLPISLSGQGLNNVTAVTLSWIDPTGASGTVTWDASDNFRGGRFSPSASGASATITPTLLAAGDPPGLYQWIVTLTNGSQTVTDRFNVTYAAAALEMPVVVGVVQPPSETNIGGEAWLDDQHQGEIDTFQAKLDLLASDTPYELRLRISEMIENAKKYSLYAILSNNIYNNKQVTMPTGWREDNTSGSFINGINGIYAETWVREVDGQVRDVIMVFRGTEPKGDWDDNFFPALTSPQEELAKIYVRTIAALYPNANIISTGHSMGGALAKAAVAGTNNKAIVFNSSPRGPESNNVVYVEEVGDPVDYIRPDRDTDVQFSFTSATDFGFFSIKERNLAEHSIYNLAYGMSLLAN